MSKSTIQNVVHLLWAVKYRIRRCFNHCTPNSDCHRRKACWVGSPLKHTIFRQLTEGYSVIIIPGLGTLQPTESVDGSKGWLEQLRDDSEGRVQIWNYKYLLKSWRFHLTTVILRAQLVGLSWYALRWEVRTCKHILDRIKQALIWLQAVQKTAYTICLSQSGRSYPKKGDCSHFLID